MRMDESLENSSKYFAQCTEINASDKNKLKRSIEDACIINQS
jgi:hypothetical protein